MLPDSLTSACVDAQPRIHSRRGWTPPHTRLARAAGGTGAAMQMGSMLAPAVEHASKERLWRIRTQRALHSLAQMLTRSSNTPTGPSERRRLLPPPPTGGSAARLPEVAATFSACMEADAAAVGAPRPQAGAARLQLKICELGQRRLASDQIGGYLRLLPPGGECRNLLPADRGRPKCKRTAGCKPYNGSH